MKPTDRISKYLSFAEATKSQAGERHGIKNHPDGTQLDAMHFVAEMVFDPVREHVGGPLHASSFFRCYEVNQLIGGSPTSQHMKGEAIDIDAHTFRNGTNKQIFDFIRKNLPFDQLIWEYGDTTEPAWVHVSLKKNGKNRGQILRIFTDPVNRRQVAVPFDLYPV